MRQKCLLKIKRLLSGAVIATSAIFFASASMPAQNPSPGSPQQNTPSPQASPMSRPGMSPMEQQQQLSQDPNSPGHMMDKAFVHKAMEGGMAEVELGKLALQKSNNDDVKQFAQKMVDDHGKLNEQMQQVAQKMNVKAPTSISSKDKSTMAKLQALNGDAFDKAYIKDMLKDHKQDEKDFKHEAESATDPDLKQVATQGAQVIAEHLQAIEQIAQKNNVASK
ncbi:MAG TPA: DUF4142 domain-containing protein [Edaphobacter sp.]|nr:DUF4142 domain-containing protein [Edaphobacter sp.]